MLRLIEVAGWRLALEGPDALTIRDIDLGERLGYERPRDVRKLIDRLEAEGKITGVQRRATVARRGFVEENGEERWLTEGQSLKIIAKSETDAADAILDEVIEVYMLARRGLLAEAQAAAGAQLEASKSRLESVVTVLSAVDLQALAVQVAGLIGRGPGRPRRGPAPGQGALFATSVQERPDDPWKGAVEAYLAGLGDSVEVSTWDVYRNAITAAPCRWDRAAQTRIGTILGCAGWANCGRKRLVTGRRMRVYRRAHQGEA